MGRPSKEYQEFVKLTDRLRSVPKTELDKKIAQHWIMAVAPKLGPNRQPCPLNVETTLDTAVVTPPERRDLLLAAKLDAVAGRILKKG